MRMSDIKDLAMIAAVIALIWYFKKYLEKGADIIAQPIADTIIGATLPGQVELVGMVVLPNGSRVPINDIGLTPNLTFSYASKPYKISHRNSSGDYVAVTV